jgi:hypothetical protein
MKNSYTMLSGLSKFKKLIPGIRIMTTSSVITTLFFISALWGYQNDTFAQAKTPWANWNENVLGVKPSWAFGKDDTLIINETEQAPTIDGNESDPCWASATWHKMNYSWLETGDKIFPTHDTISSPTTDFSVRFKMTWSSTTNKLYVLAERYDQTFLQGYNPTYNSKPDSSYTNFDMIEIFTDALGPRRNYDTMLSNTGSGEVSTIIVSPGDTVKVDPRPMHDHTFNNGGYAFHMDGSTTTGQSHVMDEPVCTAWPTSTWYNCYNMAPAEYTSHFDISVSRVGTTTEYIWEFSMDLLDSMIKVTPLSVGKTIGFSIASGDVDNFATGRKFFVGNVWLPPNRRNDGWQDLTEFGTVLLAKALPTIIPSATGEATFKIYPNPVSDIINITLPAELSVQTTVNIFNLLGEKVLSDEYNSDNIALNVSNLNSGIYFIQVSSGGQIYVSKFQKK